MLLGITHILPNARHPKPGPQPPVRHHHSRMATGQHPELRPHTKALKGDFREHRIVPPRDPPVVGAGLVVEYLDETHPRSDERGVGEVEGVERHACGGEEGKHGIRWVVEEGVGEEASRGGDERGGEALGGLGGYDPAREETREGRVVVGIGVGVDIDVVKTVVGLGEKLVPKRGEGEGVVVRNMKAILFRVDGVGLTREARRRRDSSSSGRGGGGGGGVGGVVLGVVKRRARGRERKRAHKREKESGEIIVLCGNGK
ncbi:hypothetical protein Sjap_019278 [Stephania japonica]|uniref:Uncharacterized protein n=1 Tax=Stephania japonica TaxID=461633 RepID=A0AAP0F7D3_9MAGN